MTSMEGRRNKRNCEIKVEPVKEVIKEIVKDDMYVLENKRNLIACTPKIENNSEYSFNATIANLYELDRKDNSIQFKVIKNGSIIYLSWEPFAGKITNVGDNKFRVHQCISDLPKTNKRYYIPMLLNGKRHTGVIKIENNARNGNLIFKLSKDRDNIDGNEMVHIYGSNIFWSTNE